MLGKHAMYVANIIFTIKILILLAMGEYKPFFVSAYQAH